ncbi:hypothetical protein [Ruegeria sp. Ofav3-42]|uniref:hypothetical protein n=1 Tax=Ruegeria sp. Ofav3-42 TaxID=2917759 RepID=UPI001EF5F0E6|nr:hypothetical protein [Ruegeria sp. Ofav3-42]MCG7522139.1 hypothetical protein [Ruegeria sp. Ofav3-42]
MKRAMLIVAGATLVACTQGGGKSSSGTALQASCEALISAETGVQAADVNTVSTESVPTGTITTVEVAGAQAPWLCLADAAGVVIGVEYSQDG